MALEGFLQEFGLADILQLIYFQKKTGILHIEGRQDKIRLSFINGNIVELESRKRSEKNMLGKILIKKGLLSQKNLDAALEIQKAENLKLGNIFVKNGWVSIEDLSEVIGDQITEAIVQVFGWKEGRYEFSPQELSVDKELPISLDTQHLLMGGVRIVDELSVIESKLDLEIIYKKVREPLANELSGVEREILAFVDGDNDVSTIISLSPYEEFDTSKSILALKEKGIIESLEPVPVKKEEAKPELRAGKQMSGAVVGAVIIVLIFMVKADFDAFRLFDSSALSMKIEQLKTAIDIYASSEGHYPENIESVTTERDLWGKPYVYKLTDSGFTLYSSGPDGIAGTGDDVY
ncbi:MAG: DUF4388 domain-containing protein [Nitrospirae bacterium]|nr:DUF4388 domain-containing protein [Nitrospirota bacterium]